MLDGSYVCWEERQSSYVSHDDFVTAVCRGVRACFERSNKKATAERVEAHVEIAGCLRDESADVS